jgi:hypothetical protein
MAGLFDSYGISADEVESVEGGASIPPGIYQGVVLKDEIVHGSKNDDSYLGYVISYQLKNAQGVDFQYPVQERFGLPKTPRPWDSVNPLVKDGKPMTRGNGEIVTEDSQNKWLLGILKARLLALGVPESRINGVEEGMLQGIPVVVKLVKNGDYTNVARGKEGAHAATAPAQQMSMPVAQPNPAQQPTAFAPAWQK